MMGMFHMFPVVFPMISGDLNCSSKRRRRNKGRLRGGTGGPGRAEAWGRPGKLPSCLQINPSNVNKPSIMFHNFSREIGM